jgi:hypothetical protein
MEETACLLGYWPVPYQIDGCRIGILSCLSRWRSACTSFPAKEQGIITKNYAGESSPPNPKIRKTITPEINHQSKSIAKHAEHDPKQ